jgi:hypothetical protein
MSEVWAIIVTFIIFMIVYAYVSSKISNYRNNKKREKTVPIIHDSIKKDQKYKVYLSDGRCFEEVTFAGEISNDQSAFVLGGYEGMVVLSKDTGKKIYVKKQAIRVVEEV